MGLYLNIGNAGFRSARKGEYVDKSGAYLQSITRTGNPDGKKPISTLLKLVIFLGIPDQECYQ